MTSSLKQLANKPPLTLSNNVLVANYSHYFQCNWHFSKLFFPKGHLPSDKGHQDLVPAPMPKTSSSGRHLGLTRMKKQVQIGPWGTQASRRKHQTWKHRPVFTRQETKIVTDCRNLEGRRGTGTVSENLICFLDGLGITAPNCSGLHNILLGHYWHCCSAGSVTALKTSQRKGREDAKSVCHAG